MKLARLGEAGTEVPVVEVEGTWRDARPVTADYDAAFFAGGGAARLAESLDSLPPFEAPDGQDVGSLRHGAPIARPGAVICIGMNYAEHAAESGAKPPEQPVVFLKVPNTVVGPHDDVAIPRTSTKTDWEVELGIVIGSRTSYLSSPEEAAGHIAGYVAVNDLSERAFQMEQSGGQWSKGKCCAGFSPTGPWLVTADELDPADLRLRSWVNGDSRQDSTTADMIFDPAVIVHHLSQYLVLDPGDLIMTGTPQGVALSGRFPYLTAGDVCEIEIEGLGRQRQQFV